MKMIQEREEEKRERLKCPFCNPNNSRAAGPEFFERWKIKHKYHKHSKVVKK